MSQNNMSTNPNEFEVILTVSRNDIGFPAEITRTVVVEAGDVEESGLDLVVEDMIDTLQKPL
jgi:hypothetical protein